ncbi:MAG: hypothetical protein MUE38_02430 [Flavihumibacter sp.]|jgi:hypothetical protein|nr:hypothetical protein [Flavihumibacter sp.]
MGRFFTIVIIALIAIGAGLFYWRFYWVFGEGVKSGELNFVVKKGYIFKTYEGKLIQSGFRGGMAGSIQSYEFEFSVENDQIATMLMENSGKQFDLHYKEYLGAIPWRGNTKYIVDSILSMSGQPSEKVITPKTHTPE